MYMVFRLFLVYTAFFMIVKMGVLAFRARKLSVLRPISCPCLVKATLQSVDRVHVNGNRMIVPGDYVVNSQYGIGKFVRRTEVNIAAGEPSPVQVPAVIIQYADAELTWFERFAKEELWLYRSSDTAQVIQLNSLLDSKKWAKRKRAVEEKSNTMAAELLKMQALRRTITRPRYIANDADFAAFEASFPYTETEDQRTCFREVEVDMVEKEQPMDRLVCGDVGFGKTEVAVRAIYRAVRSGRQVAVLVPTRVLARQYERTLRDRMPLVNVQVLGGRAKAAAEKVRQLIADGVCQVVVGTHAVLQPSVRFQSLGLLVVDEEQRFGVGHKEWLKDLKEQRSNCSRAALDVLTLSATPIPRTLQLSLTGMRDFSVMRTAPAGRLPVRVHMSAESRPGSERAAVSKSRPSSLESKERDGILQVARPSQNTDVLIKGAIQQELARDGQVFVVVPFIRDVPEVTARVQRLVPGVRVLEAHGGLADMEERVERFLNREADVLVATTVIETGVDLPNVNTIIVLSAERFGTATLYQLKGRVGRSQRQGHAYFITSGEPLTLQAEQRLRYIEAFSELGSGYDLALRDMELRGHGTLFGEEQSGAQDIGLDLEAKMLADAIVVASKQQLHE